MKRKSSVCALYNIRAYATPASNDFHVRPSLSRAAPELLLKISSAEGGLNSAPGEASMLTRYQGESETTCKVAFQGCTGSSMREDGEMRSDSCGR